LFLYVRPAEQFSQLATFALTRFAAVVAAGAWLFQYAVSREPPLVKLPQVAYLLLFILAIFCSFFTGVYWRRSLEVFFEGFFKVACLYLLIIHLLHTRERICQFVWLLMGLSVFNAVQGLYFYYQHPEILVAGRAQGIGFFGDPNDLAMTLVMALPFMLHFWGSQTTLGRRIILLPVLGVVLYSLYTTQSRGGTVGLMAMLYMLIYGNLRNPRWRKVFVVAGALVGLAGVQAMFTLRGASFSEAGEEGRVEIWKAGLRMIKASPLTGIGFYDFPERFDEYAIGAEQTGKAAHNSILQVAAETGLFGLAVYLAILYATARQILEINAYRRYVPLDPPFDVVARSLGPSFTGLMTCAFFLSQAYSFFVWLAIGLVMACYNVLGQEADEAAESSEMVA
jgi:O-antigen ligase